MRDGPLQNRFAHIPPQCYAKTCSGSGPARNPCYVCHTRSIPPNYVDDAALQLALDLPLLTTDNPWTNLRSPALERAPTRLDDAEVLAYVRSSNYFDADGNIALALELAQLPAAWDGDGDARWDGYVPDAYFRFDARGFDHTPDGAATGWRAFAYYPLPGSFLPSNGSAGDALVRLDRVLREDAGGRSDPRVTELNLAIVEALITRRDVIIEPEEEGDWGVDLDLDGRLGRATRVAFDGDGQRTRMHYVGRAGALERAGRFPIAPGLFPLNTELLHSLRYLDVVAGRARMAARMKELRYAKKVRWFDWDDLKAHAAAEAMEQAQTANGALDLSWQHDRGVYNRQGWLLQGFIEAADGALRPQTREESASCVGCHGGIGACTDSMFAFACKLSEPAHGYFHWTQRAIDHLPEPRRSDGAYEYTYYLQQSRGADDLLQNREAQQRFFQPNGALRRDALQALHADIAPLLLPSPARALELDRAYRAVVLEQSFVRGRDATLRASSQVSAQLTSQAATGITEALLALPLVAATGSEPGRRSRRAIGSSESRAPTPLRR